MMIITKGDNYECIEMSRNIKKDQRCIVCYS